MKLQLLLSDDELDIGMREADVALRLREPSQPDLIRRRLFTVHFHAYASAEYLKKRPQPRKPEDLDYHHLVAFGTATATHLLYALNSLLEVGRDPKNPRVPQIAVNNLSAMVRAVENGVGIAVLPDYVVQPGSNLVRLLPQADMPLMDCFLVYAEEFEDRRARSGVPRLSRRRGAALAILKRQCRARSASGTPVRPFSLGVRWRVRPQVALAHVVSKRAFGSISLRGFFGSIVR